MSNLEEGIAAITKYAETEHLGRMKDDYDFSGGIYVTVAGSHSLGINKDGRLIYFPSNTKLGSEVKDLGPATTENLGTIAYAIGRLAIHTVEAN